MGRGHSSRRLAVVTCAEMPEADDDLPVFRPLLTRAGFETLVAVWDDEHAEWARFDVVLIRVAAWAYIHRPNEFLAWARAVEATSLVVNGLSVLEWNLDKRYIADLHADRVPVVPTDWATPGQTWKPPPGEFVIKPTRGSGGFEAARYSPGDVGLAARHVERLHRAGHTVMVQPYLASVDQVGETGLIYIGGEFSHAVRKQGLLAKSTGVRDRLWEQESVSLTKASRAERDVGDAAMKSISKRAGHTVYARIDVLADASGDPVVSEAELIDPSLFLALAPTATSLLVDALTALMT